MIGETVKQGIPNSITSWLKPTSAGEIITVKAPWYDSIAVGTPSGNGQTTNLTQGYVYLHYSTPIEEPALLCGFNLNFTPVDVRVLLANETEKSAWTPFIHVPLFAVGGILSQVMPVLLLPRPQRLEPFSRVQIAIVNWGSTIENCVISLVGIREQEQLICF